MADFSLNTHHAYLNTDVIIRNNTTTTIVVKDTTTSDEWFVHKEKLIHLSAGTHHLISGKTETTITIEDAVKFGGSSIKRTFVFDDNPWLFITTKDRLYAANTETGEEKVEHTITPNSIESLGRYYGKTCEYFLFNTKKDFSIYNVETGEIVKTFTNHIYSNSHLTIYRAEESIIVYDYRIDKIVTEFDGQYSFGNKFYFVKEGKLYGLNLFTSYINLIDEVGKITEEDILYNNCLLKQTSDYLLSKTYNFYWLGNGERNINFTSFTFPYYIESWLGHSLYRTYKIKEELDSYKKDFADNNRDFPNVKHHIFSIAISKINYDWEDKKHIIKLTGEILSRPSIGFSVPFTLVGIEESSIQFKNAVIESVESETTEEKPQEPSDDIFKLPKDEKLLGKSSSGVLIVSISDSRIVYRNVKDNTKKILLNGLFDTSYYVNAYFTSDGKNAIFENCDKEFSIIGFEDLSFDKFDVEGMTVSRQAGINGYKPEIVIMDSRKPVWRDPISLVKVKQEELFNHIFMSPDGTFSAENNYKIIIRNRITEKDITSEEYNALCQKYDFNRNDSDEEKKVKTSQRKFLLEEVGKETLFKYIIDRWTHIILSSSHIPESRKEKRIWEVVDSKIEEYINKTDDFTSLFLDKLGYVIYQNNRTCEEKRILIGRSVYFLNYVSFSYDSRYLAFGAKMKQDDFCMSEDGVFVLYDLQEEKEKIRQDHGEELYAVWMTMFSKDGNVAYYDSRADAYIVTKKSDYKEIQRIAGKSLLCFSPSGKYIAFSDQNYIDYAHHPNSNWGHQPSGNIFIHAVKDVQICLERYNDFGTGISGVVSRAGSVASAAFSCDEKRLMAVGNDGVVVVRNLHFDNSDDKFKSF